MKTNQPIEKRENVTAEKLPDRPVFVPDTDIYEKDNAIVVRCDMPGVDSAGLDVTLEDHVLTVSGTQSDYAPEGHDSILGEYNTGVYRRSFTISREIDEEKIKARLHNGVLEVELPKAEQALPRRIEIETAA